MGLAHTRLNIKPKEFWEMTFPEFWAVFDQVIGPVEKPMSKDDVEDLERRFIEGKPKDGNT